MEYRPLEVTVASARDLKNVNLMTKMDVYAVVSINADPRTSKKTPVHKDSGPNPNWNHRMNFTVDEAAAQQNRLFIVFQLKSDRHLGDRDIGEVRVPINELLDRNDAKADQAASYTVITPNGKAKGTLNFSYKLGDKFSPPAVANDKHVGNAPYVAYPQPPPSAYPPQAQAGVPYAYPYPPHQGYGAYPPQPTYGYPAYPPQNGYGYGYGYPPMQKPKKNGGMGAGLGLGLAGGLLGGLLVGDMVSDVAESAAYMDGFEDGADFDF